VVTLHPSDVADDGGLDDGVFEARRGGVRLDAGQSGVEPLGDVAEHEVVVGGTG